MKPVNNAEREKKITEIRHNLAMGEEYSLKYVIPNNEARFLLSEIDRLQSIQQERDKLIQSIRNAETEIEEAGELLREDYFENWEESLERIMSAKHTMRSALRGVGEERT